MSEIVLVLHNIRSAHNVGSILRTAECAGVKRACLCGYTPAPLDRFGRKREDIAKVALGAEDMVTWKEYQSTQEAIQDLRDEGLKIIALEQDNNSVPYTTFTHKDPTALIVGEEVRGIEKEVLNLCDAIVEIPMRGKKESLNVSVAAGIALFGLVEKRA